MECKFWEEKGLLFTSGELDERETQEFDNHLKTCDFCHNELTHYQNLKNSFFKPEMLEETPPVAVDKEILRVCSAPIKPAVTSTLFNPYFRKTVYAVLILAIGFAGGAYFVGLKVDSDLKRAGHGIANKENIPLEKQEIVPPPAVASKQVIDGDTPPDSARSDSAAQIIKRGNLQTQGVVPVDLKDE